MRYELLALAPHRFAVAAFDRGRCPLTGPLTAPCRVVDTVKHRGKVELVPLFGSYFHILAQAPAHGPRTTAVRPQFLAPDDHRAGVFCCFDGHCHHAGRECCCVQPINARARTGTPGIERKHFGPSRRGRGRCIAARAQRYLKVAQAPRAFGRNGRRKKLVKSCKNGIGDHVADHMPQSDRGRVHRVHDGIFRCGYPERLQRRGVVGNLCRNSALKRVTGIGLGIDQRHVDSFGIRTRSASKIAGDMIGGDRDPTPQINRRVVPIYAHLARC